MLYPAQLYKEELKRKLIACWYDPKYKYYFGGNHDELTTPDNAYWRQDFVHLNQNGEVDGFFSYNYNDGSKAMTNFRLISFTENGSALFRDARERIIEMFQNGAQRCEFFAFADNPICKSYQRIVRRYGGKQVGYLTRSAYFDGAYHDDIIFEILREHLPSELLASLIKGE